MKNSFSINKIEYVIEDTIDDNFFVGFKIFDKKFHVYFPIGYDSKKLDEKYIKIAMRYLYKMVTLTKGIDIDKKHDLNSKNEKTIPMDSYIYVLSDYFASGMYRYNEKKYRNDIKGKINWKKTYKNTFYMQDDKPIYLNTVIQYNKRETNIITELQLYCVDKSIDMLSFIGNYNKPYHELNDQDITKNIHYYNNIIDNEMRNTNNDKKKLLLMNIKSIINDCSISDKNIRTFGTMCFEYSFEKMINKIFGSVKNISEYYPKAEWEIDGRKIPSSNLREDTIYIDKNKKIACVIDSKYYKYGIERKSGLLPNTKNVYKQIVYGDYVKEKINSDENDNFDVYNIFVIPSNNENFIKYDGKAIMKDLDNGESQKKVHLFLVNMNDIIDKYFNEKCSQTDKLINVLEKHLSKCK